MVTFYLGHFTHYAALSPRARIATVVSLPILPGRPGAAAGVWEPAEAQGGRQLVRKF